MSFDYIRKHYGVSADRIVGAHAGEKNNGNERSNERRAPGGATLC